MTMWTFVWSLIVERNPKFIIKDLIVLVSIMPNLFNIYMFLLMLKNSIEYNITFINKYLQYKVNVNGYHD